MRWINRQLDRTWKRLLAAGVLSGLIALSLSAFAESSYVQTERVRQESAAGKHCLKWGVLKDADNVEVICQKWQER